MLDVRHGKEIVVTLKNNIGALFEISKLVAETGVDLVAINGTVCDEDCTIRLVTDDNLRTKDALTNKGYSPREESVILIVLPHKSGTLRRVTEALVCEDIDIHHIYATMLEDSGKCLVVLHTAGDEHAIPKLQNMKVGWVPGHAVPS